MGPSASYFLISDEEKRDRKPQGQRGDLGMKFESRAWICTFECESRIDMFDNWMGPSNNYCTDGEKWKSLA